MSPLHPSVAFVVLLAVAPGCADRPREERKLVPIMTESGRVTYRFEDEMTEPDPREQSSSGLIPAPRFVADNRGSNDQLRREIEERRRNQVEQIIRDREERQAQQASQDVRDSQRRYQREQSRVEQQGRWQQDHDQFARGRLGRDQAAPDQRQIEAQNRSMEQRSIQDFQRLMLEQQRQSRP